MLKDVRQAAVMSENANNYLSLSSLLSQESSLQPRYQPIRKLCESETE